MWWVIAITAYGQKPSYVYFQGTQAQADAKAKLYVEVSTQPAVSGPYKTKALAEAAVKAGKVNTPNLPGGYQQKPILDLSGLTEIGKFFDSLSNPHLWLRIGEGILGILLIATAVSKLAGHTQVGQLAKKLPLVA